MKKLVSLCLFALLPGLCLAQGSHRIGQVLVKGNGTQANVGPYAQIQVCTAGTHCSSLASVYSGPSLSVKTRQPIVADSSGNYDYYVASGCVDEKISTAGQGSFYVYNVCPGNGQSGGGSGSVSGTSGHISLFTNSTTVGNALADYNLTVPNAFAFAAPVAIAPANQPAQLEFPANGIAPTVPASGVAIGVDVSVTTPSLTKWFDAPCSGLFLLTNSSGTMSSTCAAIGSGLTYSGGTLRATGGAGGSSAGPANAVQIGDGGGGWNGSGALTFDPNTNLFGMGGTTVQSTGNCFINGLDAYCGFIHDQWGQTHTASGAETQAASAFDLDWIGPSAYNGFPGGAIYAHNNTGKVKEYFSAQLRGAGFKRIRDSSQGQATGFAGIGDWSFDNIEAKYTNSFCCAADESGTAFRYNMTEYFGFLQADATDVTTTNSTAPDAAGQGPFSSPVTTVAITTADGNFNPISTGSMLGDLTGTDPSCGTAIFPVGTYPAGNACGTFTGRETLFDNSQGVGQIGISVAHGSVPDITAFGVTTAAIGDSTNRYTYDVGVAQNVTVSIHGGTTSVYTTGAVCIAGGTIECSRVTAVGPVSGGQQTLVVNVRKYHNAGAEVMQIPAPAYSLLLHDDIETFFTPYPYWVFGKVGSNLIFAVQKGGGVNYGDVFRQGSKPNAYGATWSILRSAEIIVDNTLEYHVPKYVIEDVGWVPAVGDTIVGMPFPSRRDNMYDFRDFSSNPSDQTVKSSLMSLEFGGSFGTPGAATLGYQPFSLTNYTGCTAYFTCGGKVDTPDSAMDITGAYANIFRVTQPVQSHIGDKTDSVLEVLPGIGGDAISDYNLFAFSVNGANAASVWTDSALSGDLYIGSPGDYIASSPWNVLASYKEGTGVLYGGNAYMAVVSNTGITPGTDGTWALVTTTTGGTWNSGTAYTAGAVVGWVGQTWFALRPNTNVTPGTNGDDWTILYHPAGVWESLAGFIGFADATKGYAHEKHGALSLDPMAPNTWDLGDGSYQGNTNYNLALNYLTANAGVRIPGITNATSLATDANGNVIAGSGSGLGPTTAPSGSCSTSGTWVFSQDGHATFCNGTTWVSKL